VPVVRDTAGRIKPAMDLDEFLAPEARAPGKALDLLWRGDDRVLPTPFPFRWYGDQWRLITALTPWVLVLHLYPNPRVALTTTPTHVDGVEALHAFFKGLDVDRPDARAAAWIRRGLVCLAPGDVPPSRPGEGTAIPGRLGRRHAAGLCGGRCPDDAARPGRCLDAAAGRPVGRYGRHAPPQPAGVDR
jgi:hypothetical protein